MKAGGCYPSLQETCSSGGRSFAHRPAGGPYTGIHSKQDNCLVLIAPTARWILMRRTDAQSAAVPMKISYFNGRVVLSAVTTLEKQARETLAGLAEISCMTCTVTSFCALLRQGVPGKTGSLDRQGFQGSQALLRRKALGRNCPKPCAFRAAAAARRNRKG